MAAVPICFKMPQKDCSHVVQYVARQSERCFLSECLTIPGSFRSINSIWSSNGPCKRGRTAGFFCQASMMEAQLRALDSYFGKLLDDDEQPILDCTTGQEAELLQKNNQLESRNGLDSLEVYLGKVKRDSNPENYASYGMMEMEMEMVTRSKPVGKSFSLKEDSGNLDIEPNGRADERSKYEIPKNSHVLQQLDETSDLYLISIIASVNIAVFLFEIASPIRNSELELFSIPALYGAKINQLIVVGEWWRLITPMFLHSGVLHVALGCWTLLSFGPKVCKGYGSFTFFLIYLLGGISGNLTSFLHTPELTVGGTGPTFAMIGAWLIYQVQNKDVIAKDAADSMFRKAIITTVLSFLLSSVGPIDDWTHLGAAITGITYGFFTCPILQMDDTSSSKEEGIALLQRYADPCKSVLVFALFILVLGSSVLFIEPPLGSLVSENFV